MNCNKSLVWTGCFWSSYVLVYFALRCVSVLFLLLNWRQVSFLISCIHVQNGNHSFPPQTTGRLAFCILQNGIYRVIWLNSFVFTLQVFWIWALLFLFSLFLFSGDSQESIFSLTRSSTSILHIFKGSENLSLIGLC